MHHEGHEDHEGGREIECSCVSLHVLHALHGKKRYTMENMKIMKENEKLNAVVFPSLLFMRFMVKKDTPWRT